MLLEKSRILKKDKDYYKDLIKNSLIKDEFENKDLKFILFTNSVEEVIDKVEDFHSMKNAIYSYDYLYIKIKGKEYILNSYESTLFFDFIELFKKTLNLLKDKPLFEQVYTLDTLGQIGYLDYEILISGYRAYRHDRVDNEEAPYLRLIIESGIDKKETDLGYLILKEEEVNGYINMATNFYNKKVSFAIEKAKEWDK